MVKRFHAHSVALRLPFTLFAFCFAAGAAQSNFSGVWHLINVQSVVCPDAPGQARKIRFCHHVFMCLLISCARICHHQHFPTSCRTQPPPHLHNFPHHQFIREPRLHCDRFRRQSGRTGRSELATGLTTTRVGSTALRTSAECKEALWWWL